MTAKVPCIKCGVLILPATAERTGGVCMPCKQGRRREAPQLEIPATYWSHIEAAYNRVSIYDGPVALARGLASFPDYVGDILAVHWLMSEIANGGMEQFFLNPTGVLAPEAKRGLSNMGLRRAASALMNACAKFGAKYPPDLVDREQFLLCLTAARDITDIMQAEPFEEEEKVIAQDEREIFARMNSYADENKS